MLEGAPEHPGRVVKLNLHHQGLSGPISPYLGNLMLLRELNLSRNNLSGRFPPLNRLHTLEVIDLAENSLRGTIPGTLANCSNLRRLNLTGNLLAGEVPRELGLLANLVLRTCTTPINESSLPG